MLERGRGLFNARLEILPRAQRSLWTELGQTPTNFVLYGGTAIALRLGHRQSEDFDFFSNESFQPDELLRGLPYLKGARIDQRGNNTLTVALVRETQVKLSFFGAVQMNHVQEPEFANDQGVQVAALMDLIATKLKTIQQRAEAKDYRDIVAALETGLKLCDALAAATAIYGSRFNGMTTLKALTYFEDGNLPSLPRAMRARLRAAAESVHLQELPRMNAIPGIVRKDLTR